ncbi:MULTISPECIES: DUF4352 domain-containing protein [Actinotignum]|uniref:DUF4352 domain-containing protein n=1 Tax=Actinotignum timonense TaxID=1870995 RepID=A0AAW9HCY9_9ACTO|nr:MULTISPECIES: DUF4352 domain-containing protein [Actinotignum]MBS5749439.1 DUF4352 domain-containing protein [Actinotignum schaalii]MDE1536825.1 DUF4352 domain-containing protein [Actinotignum schaalii]MDE1557495.1 DUF4352 domain-containing protein [Actinotignum schaalii]MDE1662660.1 DUF4352 domain-containing protein [Actinotignum schaalii]MDK6373418.1 DUF4352 domain-containing protein [Actinotignum timonense]
MSASTPPVYGAVPAPEQKKNWFARHKLLTALLVIVVLAIVGTALSKQSDGKPAATSSSQAADSAASGNAAEGADKKAEAEGDKGDKKDKNDDATVGIGTPVVLGDFEVTVTNVEKGVSHIGNDVLGKDATGQYVIVDVTVKNTGKEAAGFAESEQKLVDTEGRQHSVSGDSLYLGDASMIYEKVNPGNTVTGKLLYDVPADAVPAKLELETGWIHNATVNLQ